MCGIIGAVSHNDIAEDLLVGLERLEYRGYDSCGVVLLQRGNLSRARTVKRVAQLRLEVAELQLGGRLGIAHTRWATHGAPVTANAHPHMSPGDDDARISIAHNGIIENHDQLRSILKKKGYVFKSETDSEIIAHLVDSLYDGDLTDAVSQAVTELRGSFAIAVVCREEPHRLVGAKHGMPLIIGIGADGNYLASDVAAMPVGVRQVVYLEDGDVADVQLREHLVTSADGRRVGRDVRPVDGNSAAVVLGPHRYYMEKEIFEQPRAVSDTLQGIDGITPELFGDHAWRAMKQVSSVLVVACGGSYHAALTAKYWIESIARLPVHVEVASEFRYRDWCADDNTLVVAVSQSGETADVLGAIHRAKSIGMTHVLAICNVATSTLVREASMSFITRAGIEIGVASTKAFTTQLVALFLLALTLAQIRGVIDDEAEGRHLTSLRHLPDAMNKVLELEPKIVEWSKHLASRENMLFLGRGVHFPIALEGALKMKEIAYIHAEGYAAGELKHGPLALVSKEMPVIAVAPNDFLLEKLKSNMHEVSARSGRLFVFADHGCGVVRSDGVDVIQLHENYGPLSPILHTIPMQLLALHCAQARGTDVDKPRNLAKSVTVE
ncbi:Glutamine--fructose-6-phosphate aminotransferase [isomerizing] [Paraburkholderia nemoris]|uniref:glutamine--fructose-6-phosphate transaminase (isomerizing) n=1 Tax=Paraburkholderia nemoris TaxID=2793076 RepID=UPI00190CED59|nr:MULTISPECIES: glutamine--fructose-6-phosphate transaminase (isomerizing) [Paraburkholderia]MBK3786662.1 glutamine--fructose-6-phosphate transaminase (isomerizing) [Paraburkholderia aspalathi]CAE6859600.1 Glutamine--fructose-6-phosphate aminotransferase [isomerizing] [Paraburkholderia nemoris]